MGNLLTYWWITSELLVREAKCKWLQVKILCKHKNFFKIRNHSKEYFFKSNDFWGNSALWAKIADDKELSDIFLRENGFSVPKSYYLSLSEKETFNMSQTNLKFPLVVKPVNWAHGNGVTADITSEENLIQAIDLAFSFSDRIIIQQHIKGDEHRILVIGDEVVLGYKRTPASVLGNGRHTIEELIAIENKKPLRWEGYTTPLSYIVVNKHLESFIAQKWLSLSYIPGIWETVQLISVSNVWQGGTMKWITDLINNDIRYECIAIAKQMGLFIAWIDIITTDISKSLEETWWTIIEINANPGFWGSIEFTGINPAKILLEKIFW